MAIFVHLDGLVLESLVNIIRQIYLEVANTLSLVTRRILISELLNFKLSVFVFVDLFVVFHGIRKSRITCKDIGRPP